MNKSARKNIEEIIALTTLQEGMLFHYLQEPDSDVYFEQLSLGLTGDINIEIFEQAWNVVIRTNEMLRTMFRWENLENPIQLVLKEHVLKPVYYDVSAEHGHKREESLKEIIARERDKKFDLRHVPFRVTLCKKEKNKYELILSNHHILYDGWSTGIILKEFFRAYHALSNEKEMVLPGKTKFREFIKWVQSREADKQEEFWQDYLKGFDTPGELPIKTKNKGAASTGNYSITFTGEVKKELERLAETYKVTMAALLYSAWGLLLQKYNRGDDVIFGTTVSGRSAKVPGIENMVGLFINTIPLRVQTGPHESIGDILRRVNTALQKREAYDHTPLVKIKEYSELGNEEHFFDHIVVIENYPLDNSLVPGNSRLSLESFSMAEKTHYDLTVGITVFENIKVTFAYNQEKFTEDSMVRLAHHFRAMLETISHDPETQIPAIEIISPREKEQLLYEFNDTAAEFPKNKTIQRLFAEQVERTPDNTAAAGPQPVKNRTNRTYMTYISYRELSNRAHGLAGALQQKGIGPDTIAAIMAARSVEMIIGILGILKAGGAYLPIDPDYPQSRIDYILKDSGAEILLKDADIHPSTLPLFYPSSSSNLAYIIYTSGSTGRPKGVMIEHGALINLCYWHNRYFQVTHRDRAVQYANIGFDASVWEIFPYLIAGACLHIIADEKKADLRLLSQYYEKHHITIGFLPTQMCQEFMKHENPNYSLRKLLTGGDKLRAFHQREYDLYNNYGPTENAVVTTSYLVKGDTYNIPIGKPIANHQVYILDNYNSQLQPIGVPGELCISGAGLARGYLNRPGLTAERFLFNRSYRSYRSYIPKKLYKTGDLAGWLPDGNIEFLGRIDQQVKVRGFRIELGEIENQLLTHKHIKEAVVIPGTDEEGNNYLCAYYVPAPGVSPDILLKVQDLRDYLSGRLPGFMIPSYFVSLEQIPLTPSGKVDRKALPEPNLGIQQTYVPPGNALEMKLVDIWAEVLGRGGGIGIDDHFFQLGGHSLKATRMVNKVNKTFSVNIRLKEFVESPTIRKLASMIEQAKNETRNEITPVPEMEYYPLSYAQRRLWIICQFEEDSRAYNIVGAVTISGDFKAEVFQQAVQALIHRHESLRTVFINVKGEPKQKIIKDLPYTLEPIDLRGFNEIEKEKNTREIFRVDANQVFNLEKGPLFLFKLLRLEDKKYFLIFNCHHLVNDGWSIGIINNELFTLYNSFLNNQTNSLPPLELQYKDYTLWHNHLIESREMDAYAPYWFEKFKDKPNGIELPLDHPRKPLQTFNGGRVYFTVNRRQLETLHRLNREENVTLFMTMLALVAVFLHHYTAQEDIIVASPMAGRQKAELQSMIGFLVNTLVYRMQINPDLTFNQFLQLVKKETLESYENQDYPFDLLVEKLESDRDLSRSPVFNVMLAFNNTDTRDYDMGMSGVTVDYHFYLEEYTPSVFDLVFIMEERFNEIFSEIMYNRDLFKPETAERMAANFRELVKNVLDNPHEPLHSIKYITSPEYKKIIHEFNDRQREFPPLTVQEMAERQVEKSRDKTAVVYNDQAITYGEFNRRVNQLAHYLREEHRVAPNEILGVFMDRSIEMVQAIMGIIKSGAGYVAIDPNYPRERIEHMIADSRAKLIIIDQMREELDRHDPGQLIDIYRDWDKIAGQPGENPVIVNQSLDILYIIYTSGSTGTPNGAMLSHGILSNLVQWQAKETTIDSSLKCLQFTSINFCVSFQEIMTTLTSAGQLYLIGDIERRDIDYLMDFLSSRKIEILYLPFSYLNFLFNQSERTRELSSFNHSLRHIITAGEQLKITAGLKQFLEKNPGIHLHNHYGSSEMHVVTSYTLDASMVEDNPIPPAGKPIANTRIYILDDYYQPVPIGVWGELFVSGSFEVLGYIHNEELTRRKLVEQPRLPTGGKKLYRSGDMGRWHPDGNIELQGRKDTQVKIRGFRIEPGEIESKILAIAGVKDCVVEVKPDKKGEKYLMAYVVTDQTPVREIKKIIGNYLPAYMIPKFMVLDRLPLLPSGKVDREQLPEPTVRDQELRENKPINLVHEATALVNRYFFHGMEAVNKESAIFTETLTNDDLRRLFLDIDNRQSTVGDSPGQLLHQRFEARAEQHPDQVALSGKEISMTYRELNERSNQVAHFLKKKGVQAGTVVGLIMEPSMDMVIAMLGILKAGAAYLFIEPGTGKTGTARMLQENRVPLVLTQSDQVDHHGFAALQDLKRTEANLSLHSTTPRQAVTDFDMLPMPDRSLVNYEKYLDFIGITLVKNCITLQSTRGCPYRCAFCHKIWPKKHVTRSAHHIFQEIAFYYNLGIRRFAFIDDIFNLDMKNSARLFELIIETGLEVQLFFSGGLRGDILTPGYIDLMVKAGTVSIALALESASPRMQKLIGKDLNLEKFRENIEYICHTYPEVILELHTMHGFPTETEAEALQTLEFIKSLHWIDFPYIHIMKIYPNTEMEKLALAHGISREAIAASEGRAYHELQETLHFDKSFTLNYQAEFLNSYFLSAQRLRCVLPRQMKVLTEDDLVQKYNSYLPVEIKTFEQLLEFVGITRSELARLGAAACFDETPLKVPRFNQMLKNSFTREEPADNALRVLLLDLSQYFSGESRMLYDVVEAPLGLLYLLTWMHRHFAGQIKGKIAKSRVDFDDYQQLRQLVEEFKPQVMGIRTLTFYKDFFHKTLAMIRHWVGDIPIIAGGPYATSDYETILQDPNVDIVVLGEGEITFNELMAVIIANRGKLPDEAILKQIPGIVFVSSREAAGTQRGYAREILFMDQLTGHLQKESIDNPVPGNLEPAGQLAGVIYPPVTVTPGQPGRIQLDHRQVNGLFAGMEKRFYEKSGLAGKVDLAVSCMTGSWHAPVFQVMGALIGGGSVYVLPRHMDGKDIHLLEYYTHKNSSREDPAGMVPYIRLIAAPGDKDMEEKDGKAAPRDRVEEALAEMWSELLGVEKAALGIEDNFFELGGHSLKATTLIAKIHRRFEVKIKLLDLFTAPTIKEIARLIKKESRTREEAVMPAEEKEYYPLSPAQKRLYLVQQIEVQTTNYNMFDAFELEGEPDKQKLETTFRRLIRRQASFRTSFITLDDVPVQRIHPEVEFGIENYMAHELHEKNNEKLLRGEPDQLVSGSVGQWVSSMTGSPGNESLIMAPRQQPQTNENQHKRFAQHIGPPRRGAPGRRRQSFIKPFDLSRAPLLRVGLIELSPERHILMVDINHIISDGTSIGILINEFMALYREEALPSLSLQYKDYSQWQNSSRYRQSIQNQAEYWHSQYQGEIPRLELPLDFPRPAIQVFAGDEVRFELDEHMTARLHRLALSGEATLYMLLLAFYTILLSRLSRQEDIIVGTPIAGRKYEALQSILGMFVNTLAMRNFPVKTKTFKEFLAEVKARTLRAFENQDYPFEELVERGAGARDSSRNPLFDVMFALQNLDLPEAGIPGLKLKPYPHHLHNSPFELILNAEEKDGKLLFKFWFCTALFKKEKIQRFILYFKEIISHVIENMDIQLADIKISHELKEQKIIIPRQVREGFNF